MHKSKKSRALFLDGASSGEVLRINQKKKIRALTSKGVNNILNFALLDCKIFIVLAAADDWSCVL